MMGVLIGRRREQEELQEALDATGPELVAVELVIDKAYACELARKRDVFVRVAGARKSVFITLVTTQGVRRNEHAQRLGVQVVTMDALLR